MIYHKLQYFETCKTSGFYREVVDTFALQGGYNSAYFVYTHKNEVDRVTQSV
jgi:hypothetical protein